MNKDTRFLSHIAFPLIVSLLFLSTDLSAASLDTIAQPSYLKIGVVNDFLQGRQATDKYFSAAFSLGLSHEIFDNKVAGKALLAPEKGIANYSINLTQSGYTPENLSLVEIDSADRPYAGVLTLDYDMAARLPQRYVSYVTSLKLGISGPFSFVENMQKGIHELTGSTPPMGWANQIESSLIISYFAAAEKQFFNKIRYLRLSLGAYGEVGSFQNYMGVYGRVRLGWFHQEFLPIYIIDYRQGRGRQRWQYYLTLGASAKATLYDGTLQGGLLPFKRSPHVFVRGDYQHHTWHTEYAFVVSYKSYQIICRNVIEINRFFLDELFMFGEISLSIPF